MTMTLDTVLLLALPASGKSEVRKYLDGLDRRECAGDFHMNPTVQLDDFPYVHMMRQTDELLRLAGQETIFFRAADKPFKDTRDWLTLIELVNEDFDDLVARRPIQADSAADWLLGRLDAARARAGAPAAIAALDSDTRGKLVAGLEEESRALLDEKLANYPDRLEGKTLVIEFARGGPDGSSMPLPAHYGYAHSLAQLSPAILDRAAILYIWVTPQESRRKNEARADPDDPGSILHHGVPIDVMLGDYGCDDIDHLLSISGKDGHVKVDAHGESYLLPIGRFDNRVDKTSFIRDDRSQWKNEDVEALHQGLKKALAELHTNASA